MAALAVAQVQENSIAVEIIKEISGHICWLHVALIYSWILQCLDLGLVPNRDNEPVTNRSSKPSGCYSPNDEVSKEMICLYRSAVCVVLSRRYLHCGKACFTTWKSCIIPLHQREFVSILCRYASGRSRRCRLHTKVLAGRADRLKGVDPEYQDDVARALELVRYSQSSS